MLIQANLSTAARKAIEMQPGLERFFTAAQRRNYERGRAEGKAEGKAEGEIAALLKILTRRRLALSTEQRRCILGCTDLAVLERWLDRSLSVSSVAELLAEPVRVRRNGHRGTRVARNGNGRSR